MKKSKTLNKITALIVICILWLSCFSCGHENNNPNCLPPEYKMMTDGNGNYVPVMPGGTKLGKYPGEPFKNYDNALKRAWSQYNHKPTISKLDTMKLILIDEGIKAR